MEDPLWTFSTVLAPISPLPPYLENRKGLEQSLQSKDLVHATLQSFPELLGLSILLSTKREYFCAAYMACGSWPALVP